MKTMWLEISSEILHVLPENRVVLVDVIEIRITNVTSLTVKATIGVVTRERGNNAYIKWVVSLSLLVIESIETSV